MFIFIKEGTAGVATSHQREHEIYLNQRGCLCSELTTKEYNFLFRHCNVGGDA